MLDNQERILEYIKKFPGQTQSQISHRMNISQSTLKYHLMQLIKENKISVEKLFKSHYFHVGIDSKVKKISCIENNNHLKNIYYNLGQKMTLDEISSLCNIQKSLASKRLKVLISLGAAYRLKVDGKIVFSKMEI